MGSECGSMKNVLEEKYVLTLPKTCSLTNTNEHNLLEFQVSSGYFLDPQLNRYGLRKIHALELIKEEIPPAIVKKRHQDLQNIILTTPQTQATPNGPQTEQLGKLMDFWQGLAYHMLFPRKQSTSETQNPLPGLAVYNTLPGIDLITPNCEDMNKYGQLCHQNKLQNLRLEKLQILINKKQVGTVASNEPVLNIPHSDPLKAPLPSVCDSESRVPLDISRLKDSVIDTMDGDEHSLGLLQQTHTVLSLQEVECRQEIDKLSVRIAEQLKKIKQHIRQQVVTCGYIPSELLDSEAFTGYRERVVLIVRYQMGLELEHYRDLLQKSPTYFELCRKATVRLQTLATDANIETELEFGRKISSFYSAYIGGGEGSE